jgi:hypothetical protein
MLAEALAAHEIPHRIEPAAAPRLADPGRLCKRAFPSFLREELDKANLELVLAFLPQELVSKKIIRLPSQLQSERIRSDVVVSGKADHILDCPVPHWVGR